MSDQEERIQEEELGWAAFPLVGPIWSRPSSPWDVLSLSPGELPLSPMWDFSDLHSHAVCQLNISHHAEDTNNDVDEEEFMDAVNSVLLSAIQSVVQLCIEYTMVEFKKKKQSLVDGKGLPGQAFFNSTLILVTGAETLAASHCERARQVQGFGLQTIGRVIQLGSTEYWDDLIKPFSFPRTNSYRKRSTGTITTATCLGDGDMQMIQQFGEQTCEEESQRRLSGQFVKLYERELSYGKRRRSDEKTITTTSLEHNDMQQQFGKKTCEEESQQSFSGQLVHLSKRGLSFRKRGRSEKSVSIEDLQQHFGKRTREEAAEYLGVSVATLKRKCRKHGICRWPNKDDEHSLSELEGINVPVQVADEGEVAQPSLTTTTLPGSIVAFPQTNVNQSAAYLMGDSVYMQPEQIQECSPTDPLPCSNPPTLKLATATVVHTTQPETTMQDARSMTVKATYGDDIFQFHLSSSSKLVDLEEEVAKRLKAIHKKKRLKFVKRFIMKYMAEDGDWVSVACDGDLFYCMGTLRSLGRTTIKILIEPITN